MGILNEFNGVSVHDFWKSYEKYACSHAYCNAHIIRELIFVVERKSQQWAGDLIDLLLEIKKRLISQIKILLFPMKLNTTKKNIVN